MSLLATFELRATRGFRCGQVYLFGCPRLGDRAFVDAFNQAAEHQGVSPPVWRIIHDKDPIPRFGAWGSDHTYHPPREVLYSEAQNSYRICSAIDGDDPNCASSIPWYSCVSSAPMHLNY